MNLSLRPLLRLAAGVVFLAAVLSVTSCADRADLVSDDTIDAYCNTACTAPTVPPSVSASEARLEACQTSLEGVERQAEDASCGDAFLAYFRCEQRLAQEYRDCGIGENCSQELSALVACENANDPDNVCFLGEKRVAACDPAFAEVLPYGRFPCIGLDVCDLFCFQDATCEEISDVYETFYETQGVDNGLTRCFGACNIARTNGAIGWLEDN